MPNAAGRATHTAIVLQGGGALGAYEFGVLKALYEQRAEFRPAVVSGISIGAITAAVLGGAKCHPMQALDQLWKRGFVVASPPFHRCLPGPVKALSSLFFNPAILCNRGMYRPNIRVFTQPWAATSYYDTGPLHRTLKTVLDLNKLNSGAIRVILGATRIRSAELQFFDSQRRGLSVKEIVASACFPPGLPITTVSGDQYWDGGLLSNLPLSPAINALEELAHDDREAELELISVELFPMNAPIPQNMLEVLERMVQLIFSSKLTLDAQFFRKMDRLVDFAAQLDDELPPDSRARRSEAFRMLRAHRRIRHFNVVTSSLSPELSNAADFSYDAIQARIEIGYQDALRQGIGRRDSPGLHPGVIRTRSNGV